MQMPEIDFSALEIREIGTWPFMLRCAIVAAAGILAVMAAYFVIIKPYVEELDLQETALTAKRTEFKEKYDMAVNLDAYKQQMIEMKEMYKEYLKALPSSSNIAELIANISRLGEKNNLKFESIKIGSEKVSSGFYMELPIDIVIVGSYNNIGIFISDLSKLSRIVTVEDFSIKPVVADSINNNPGLLSMNLSTKTYWVASASEQQSDPANKGKATNSVGAAAASPPVNNPDPTMMPGAPSPPKFNPGGQE